MERKYRLIYFNIRGLAEPIRWMFRLKDVDFEDERIELDQWPEERESKCPLDKTRIDFIKNNFQYSIINITE